MLCAIAIIIIGKGRAHYIRIQMQFKDHNENDLFDVFGRKYFVFHPH